MMCVNVDQKGFIVKSQQPATFENCSFVIADGSYFSSNPFWLTRDEGLHVGLAIALIWVVVGVIKRISVTAL